MYSDVSPFNVYTDIENSRTYIDELYSPDAERCLKSLVCLKNAVIGSNRRKGSLIAQGVVPRLMQILQDRTLSSNIREQAAITIGSLAKGTEDHVQLLISSGVINSLLIVLEEDDKSLIDACLSCLRTLAEKDEGPNRTEYAAHQLKRILGFANTNGEFNNSKLQSYVASILSAVCQGVLEQNTLRSVGTSAVMAKLLAQSHHNVYIPVLKCLSAMAFQNGTVAADITYATYENFTMLDLLLKLASRDRSVEIQLEAARCLTNLHRAGAINAKHDAILYRTLPCLIRLCQKEHSIPRRAIAADTLAYLIEMDINLQQTTAISNQLISALADLVNSSDDKGKQGAFRAFASVSANDENIRKRIIETDRLMERVVEGLDDPSEDTRLAAVRCLHSLSRSVQLLRTTFQDHTVWRPLMALFGGQGGTPPPELLSVASSALCNLLLEFSPAKEPILHQGAIHLLASLTKRSESALRLNGVWALMNLAFQSEQRIKSQILTVLGTDRVFRLLADSETRIVMKTLGLLRNLVSPRAHTDAMMELHGTQVMQAIIVVLEGSYTPEVKEQALCILANIADGEQAKDNIMTNEDVLKKLIGYMTHTSNRLQAAAVCCISNLARSEEPGFIDRQTRLRELGVSTILHQLLLTPDALLFDKVKNAVSQFTDI